jgi:hypothetical protein
MLDWLATNHHDFMRLNDFSEAFSLLRWLKKANVAHILVDMDGEGPEIATPDRIVIGDGRRWEVDAPLDSAILPVGCAGTGNATSAPGLWIRCTRTLPAADRLDSVLLPVLLVEAPHQRGGRSSSA